MSHGTLASILIIPLFFRTVFLDVLFFGNVDKSSTLADFDMQPESIFELRIFTAQSFLRCSLLKHNGMLL